MVKLWHSAVRLEWVCEESSHPWKMLLSSFAFLSCLCNLTPKVWTALDALTLAAVNRADLLIVLGKKPGCAFPPPKKRNTWSITLKPGKGSPVFW